MLKFSLLFFGRVANYINSELWGKVTTVSWGVIFPNAGNLARHPSQLYEAILEGLVIFILLFIMIKKNLLYYNGLKNQPMFNQELKFEKHLISLECDDSRVEDKIIEAVNTLKADEMPNGSKGCDTCQYLKKRWKVSQNLSTS